MTGHRNALLIGVPKYRDHDIESFSEVISRDFERLRCVLEASDYQVQSNDLEDMISSTRNQMRARIERFLSSVPQDSTAVLYLSGHGIHLNGGDFLVPCDATPSRLAKAEEDLLKLDFAKQVEDSPAKTVLFLIDCCRQGISTCSKAELQLGWATSKIAKVANQAFVLFYACGSGEFARYQKENGDRPAFSYFARALCDVLDPRHPAVMLGEVVTAVRKKVEQEVRDELDHSQHPVALYPADLPKEAADQRLICRGGAEPPESLTETSWWGAVRHSRLWTTIAEPQADEEHLVKSVEEFARKSWDQYVSWRSVAIDDPWRDSTFVQRTLARLSELVDSEQQNLALSRAEVVITLVAPIIREVVLMGALSSLPHSLWLNVAPVANPPPLRDSLERLHRKLPRIVRRIEGLAARGDPAHIAIAMWLAHRCLISEPDLWMPEPSGFMRLNLTDLLAPDAHPLLVEVLGENCSEAVLQIARSCDVGSGLLRRSPHAIGAVCSAVPGASPAIVRPELLGHLLEISSAMAFDVRQSSAVIVEHIGLPDGVAPPDLLDIAATARWRRTGPKLSISQLCRHPALEVGIHESLDRVAHALSEAHRAAARSPATLQSLDTLPLLVERSKIAPHTDKNGVQAYTTPLLRFNLATEELREVLLGERLYGDPLIAIRELYQNALDACRYRDVRTRYLRKLRRYRGTDQDWKGHIKFLIGDEDGRTFIECEDNGIGMGVEELMGAFACAGRRFHDLPEYIDEKREWHRFGDASLRLYPNSQFGIGVFSYFMLAEELTIDTCRLDRTGVPGGRLHVRVPGSGSLFRIQEGSKGKASGTRIRLYLSDARDQDTAARAGDRLREMLWKAEFDTFLNYRGIEVRWPAGELCVPGEDWPRPCPSDDANLWFTHGSSAILVDGILVPDALDAAAAGTPSKPNYEPVRVNLPPASDEIARNGALAGFNLRQCVVNFTGPRRHVLSVDRRRLLSAELSWVNDAIQRSAHTLAKWEHLTLEWMSALAETHPVLLEEVTEILVRDRSEIRVIVDNAIAVDLSVVGCVPGSAMLYREALALGRVQGDSWYFAQLRFSYSDVTSMIQRRQLRRVAALLPKDLRLRVRARLGVLWDVADRLYLRLSYPLDRIAKKWLAGAAMAIVEMRRDDAPDIIKRARSEGALRPLDTILAKYAWDSGDKYIHRPTIPALVRYAVELQEKLNNESNRMRRVGCAHGLTTGKSAAFDFVPPYRDGEFLSLKYYQWRTDYNEITGLHALFAAIELDMDLDEVDRIMERYMDLGLRRSANWQRGARADIDSKDAILIRHINARHSEVLRFLGVAQLAVLNDETISATIVRLRKFEPFGLTIGVDEPIPQVLDRLESKQIEALLEFERYFPFNVGGRFHRQKKIGAFDIYVVAARMNMAVGDVLDGTKAALQYAGYGLPELDADLLAVRPSSVSLVVASRDLDGMRPWIKGATESHIVSAARKTGESPEQVRARIREVGKFRGVPGSDL